MIVDSSCQYLPYQPWPNSESFQRLGKLRATHMPKRLSRNWNSSATHGNSKKCCFKIFLCAATLWHSWDDNFGFLLTVNNCQIVFSGENLSKWFFPVALRQRIGYHRWDTPSTAIVLFVHLLTKTQAQWAPFDTKTQLEFFEVFWSKTPFESGLLPPDLSKKVLECSKALSKQNKPKSLKPLTKILRNTLIYFNSNTKIPKNHTRNPATKGLVKSNGFFCYFLAHLSPIRFPLFPICPQFPQQQNSFWETKVESKIGRQRRETVGDTGTEERHADSI